MINIFAITETWLTNHIYNNEILPPNNFAIYCNNRESCGGGVLLAMDLSIPSKVISSPDDIEAITVHLLTDNPINCVLRIILQIVT